MTLYGKNAKKYCKQSCQRNIPIAEAKYTTHPTVLAISMEQVEGAAVDINIRINDINKRQHSLCLLGLVYFGFKHFMARIIDKSTNIWFHDGLHMKDKCLLEGPFTSFSPENL